MTHRADIAIEQLTRIAELSEGSFEILNKKPNVSSYAYEVTVSIYCGDIACSDDGIHLRDRELFAIYIPRDFPFRYPTVDVLHKRFAGHTHVQWQKRLCLFQAPESEWNPSDGMFGFIERLMIWLKKAAVDELDPEGVPLHPPVAYTKYSSPLVIPRANTPTVDAVPWIGKTVLDFISDKRVDIVGWCDALEGNDKKSGAAFLLSSKMPFEYPANVKDLLLKLEKSGVPRNLLLITMQLAILDNEEGDPLYVVVGSPMRGIAGSDQLRQHLAVWYIEPDVVKGLRLAVCKYSEDAQRRQIGEECEKIILEWAEKALIVWCKVREDRPEVTIRRDNKSSLTWFRGKRVSLFGCGALGSHVAECLVRAGVKELILYDNSVVAPGLLVRQLYEDGDIGKFKADALDKRLNKIYPAKTEFIVKICNILDDPLEVEKFDNEVDVIIDTTGNESVSKKLELTRKEIMSPPHLASLCIGHNAKLAKAVLSLSSHSGGPLDVNRATKSMLANKGLNDYLEEFWPEERRELFQPEPGCSDITFTGSSADIAALSGLMLNSISMSLTQETESSAFAFLFTQQHRGNNGYINFEWEKDVILQDPHADFEIRLECSAWREIEGWCKTSKRCFGDRVETGGLLFGEVDELLQIIWVSEVSGPPVDSIQSEIKFICGIKGVDELEDEKRKRSRGSVGFVGMWHSHPSGMSLPSRDDYEGMQQLVVGRHNPAMGSLLLIVGTPYTTPALGSYYFKKEDFGERIHIRECEVKVPSLITRENDIGIALSGGGSRAIAFHLGSMRALHDRGILDQAKVISAVSGGSIIAAIYAFSQDSFENFDKKVVELLRRGIEGDIIKQCLAPKNLLPALGTLALSGSAAALSRLAGHLLKKQFVPPLHRWRSRTTAFKEVLHSRLFGDSFLGDQTHNNIDIVINATELRTGSAFRFGSRESGCWRFGKVVNNAISVAEAVAASAAYPALLPAIDKKYTFIDSKGIETKKRIILTDGGIYDNLGISCLDPNRSKDYSTNVFKPAYIICCSAGRGLFQDNVIPYFAFDRMKRSLDSVFRKFQDSGYAKLHQLVESGKLKGFILPYLGQLDNKLPFIPPDLVKREQVFGYPTDFSPMNHDTIQLLSKRGEQLTRLLIERYIPEL